MSRRSDQRTELVVGAVPRVDLLPPEIKARVHDRSVRRGLIIGAILALVIVIAGYLFGSYLQQSKQSALVDQQAQTQALVTQEQKYAAASQIEKQIVIAQAAQRVGTSSEIDWNKVIDLATAALGPGMSITAVSGEGATPFDAYSVPSLPLQKSRIATLELTASSPDVASVSVWLQNLSSVSGVVDTVPGAIAAQAGGFTATVILHLDSTALTNRFAKEVTK